MADEQERVRIAGRYEILEALGRGGMGKVFHVHDAETGRELALKMLRSQWQQHPQAVARFMREMETVRQLKHPGIVRVFDTHVEDGLLFYTMEYVRGKSLRQWMSKRGRIGLGSTVRVLCLVADALDHAHAVTIHRDLSPENIMVLKDGSVRLLDFGLAKLQDTQQVLTMVGASLGKLQYVAPEQRSNAARVDHRADLYPLGVMFYEMLTGALPDSVHRMHDIRPDLPLACDDFVAKALAVDPDGRFQSAREFRRALLALYQQYAPNGNGPVPGRDDTLPPVKVRTTVRLERPEADRWRQRIYRWVLRRWNKA
jgi:serine/threonine-protein kinase